MRIMGLAATAALMATASGSAVLACEAPGACAYAPSSNAYVFQPPAPRPPAPMSRPAPRPPGPASDAYVFSPGPTPAYAGDEAGPRPHGGYQAGAELRDRSGGAERFSEHRQSGYASGSAYQGRAMHEGAGEYAAGAYGREDSGYGAGRVHRGRKAHESRRFSRKRQMHAFHHGAMGGYGADEAGSSYREGGRYGVRGGSRAGVLLNGYGDRSSAERGGMEQSYAQSGGSQVYASGGMRTYGEVRSSEGYASSYTPAFGRGVAAERPYTGPGYGYRFDQRGCNVGCGPRGPVGYVQNETDYAEGARPVQVGPDFFYGGINGGAGYGVDGGSWGGGGGVFADSGFGYSATQAFSRGNAFAGASASAHASAVAFSYGGRGKTMKHGGGCGCGGKGGKH